MDQLTAERIAQLAKNLKEHHLAGTMEEAYARAKEIVIGAGETQEKSINEIMGIVDNIKDANQKIHEVKEKFEKDIQRHKKEKKETQELKTEIKKEKKISNIILEDAQAIIEMSKQVQKEHDR